MELNATLLGQLIAFGVFFWGCRRWAWPAVVAVLDERQRTIAQGLEASKRGERSLKLAQESATEQLRKAKMNSKQLLVSAQRQSEHLIQNAQREAQQEAERLLKAGQHALLLAQQQHEEAFREQAVGLVIAATEKILQQQPPALDEQQVAQLLHSLPPQLCKQRGDA